MDDVTRVPSKRRALGEKIPLSASALIAPSVNLRNATFTSLWELHDAEPFQLLRTGEGRNLSRARYRRAQEFMLPLEPGTPVEWPDFLYGAGIVIQLALSSHLLDVGFADRWCARYIGLYVAKSLSYANASGLGLECQETARLAHVLSPYSQWNCRCRADDPRPDDGGFTSMEIRSLLLKMMDHVGNVTGHRPQRRKIVRDEAATK